jgi:polynucleotide 5'-kinase involved in rRNA processing
LKIPENWTRGINKALKNTTLPVIYICGPKNVGKSTFSRILTNSILSKYRKVAYLDSDLGQSEFTPNGSVSLTLLDGPLLGPPFTHTIVGDTIKSIYLGTTSPWKNPDSYIDAILSLYRFYESDIQKQDVPLVINSHGWVKGTTDMVMI